MGQDKPEFPELPRSVIAAAQGGDPAAFEAILTRYERAAFSLAYRMCYDRHLASDITQEIFLQLYQQLHRFDLNRPFSPWFFRLATNKTINSIKQRRNRRQTVLSEVGDEDGRDPGEQAIDQQPRASEKVVQDEQNQRLRQVIANLPAKYSAIVSLRYIEEQSVESIASTLDMPVGTVKVRLYRARDLIKQRLADAGFDD